MRLVLISPEFIIKQKTASGNYKYLTGIDRFRSCEDRFEFLCISSAADAAQILMK